jgi:DNA-nicking Smr family endonuclease
MSTGGDPPRRRGRRLTGEERALWRTITHSVSPLRPQAVPDPVRDETAATDVVEAPAPVQNPPRTKAPAAPATPAPLAPLDRRVRQRLARGSVAPDGRIDLHGMTQERAHRALLRFLRSAQGDEMKLVLVITGKGARMRAEHGAERGVLRRLVPQWLALPEFRPYVIGFETAHIAHGGEGALYVRVRRGR